MTQSVARSVVVGAEGDSLALDLSAPGPSRRSWRPFLRALTDLPMLRITTKDAAPIVSKEVYVDATFA